MKFKSPFLIAEISANHNGNLENALKLIKTAKLYGADAVKIQTYTPNSMTLNSNKKYFKINHGLWKGYNLWKLYDEAKTPYIWHKKLFQYAKKIRIKIFSTPFDENAVDFLESLNCPFYKVSSFEMTDLPLIKKIAQTKKPMIISTGTSDLDEIAETYYIAKKNGCRDITLLYCVSNYPSELKDFNLNNILILKKKFRCRVGLSDHSNNNIIAQIAAALGAEVFEKHIALQNQKKGLDLKFSLKGSALKDFKNDLTIVNKIMGKKKFFRTVKENKNKILRRSIFAALDIKKGEKFTHKNIRRVRPGHGVSPKYFDRIMNKKAPNKIYKGEPINKTILSKLKINI